MRRFFLAVESLEGRAVDEIDIEPAIVVVVDQSNAGAICLQDELLVGVAHLMRPMRDARLLGDVLKDDRPQGDESPGSDRTLVAVKLHRMGRASSSAAARSRLGAF